MAEATEWKWSGGTVSKILENQYYVGDSVHNQFTNDTWAAKKQKANPKEEWIIVENTHEALVSREDFKTVQEMMLKKKEKKRKPKNKGAGSVSSFNFFKEKIVCADCGKTMYLRGRVDGNKFFLSVEIIP